MKDINRIISKSRVYLPGRHTGGAISQKSIEPHVNNPSASIPGLGTGSKTTVANEHRSAGTSIRFGGGYLDGLSQLNFGSKSGKKQTNAKLKI